MNIVKKLLCITLLASSMTTPIHSMGSARFASWAAFTICTCASMPMLAQSISRLAKHALATDMAGEEAPLLLKDFVHAVAEREGVADPTSIKVYVQPYESSSASSGYAKNFRGIAINKLYADAALDALTKTSNRYTIMNPPSANLTYNSDEYLTLQRAIITHEIGHIEHEHIKKEALASCIIPCLSTYTGLKLIKRYRPNKIALMAFAPLIYGINELLFKKYSRICEYEADDMVTDPAEIRSRIAFYRADNDYPPKDIGERINYIAESLLSTHPRSYKRADRYEKRLQAYKAEASRIQK